MIERKQVRCTVCKCVSRGRVPVGGDGETLYPKKHFTPESYDPRRPRNFRRPKCEGSEVPGITEGVRQLRPPLSILTVEGTQVPDGEYQTESGGSIHVKDSVLVEPEIDILALERERMAWSLETFPEATALSSLYKLRTEIDEIEVDLNLGISEPLEYADALMCLFDSAGRKGISPETMFEAFAQKLEINKARTWIKNPDNSYSHVKE